MISIMQFIILCLKHIISYVFFSLGAFMLSSTIHGICDAGSRLLFKFRSGTHVLNEELGRHRGREGKTECSLCGNECENVSHVL